MRPRVLLLFVLIVCLGLLACSGGPTTPAAEQYFIDAKKNLDAADFSAALKNLDRMTKAAGDTPLGQQGGVLRTAVLVALTDGTKQMAEAYGIGVKQPPAQARHTEFARLRSDYYGIARVRLLEAMQAVMDQRSKLGEKPMPLDVKFPEFSGTPPAAINKIEGGYWVQEGDRYRAELEAERNALARTLARLAGAGDDVHKGHAMFEKGGVEFDPRVYLIELSNSFQQLGEIFGRRALDDPRYLRIATEVTRDNIDTALKLLQANPDKDLEARAKKIKAECEKQLKTLGS